MRTKLAALCLGMSLICLCACTAPKAQPVTASQSPGSPLQSMEPESSAAPSEKMPERAGTSYAYQPYLLPEAVVSRMGGNAYRDYCAVVDALREGRESVTGLHITSLSEFEMIRQVFGEYYIPRQRLKDADYAAGTGPLTYEPDRDEITIRYLYVPAAVALWTHDFEAQIETIFHENVTDLADEARTASELFGYLADNIEYRSAEEDEKADTLAVFNAKTGTDLTLARAYRFLLTQAGITSCLAYAGDTAYAQEHYWNFVRLGNHYFHMDVAWDTGDYFYFGMTDEEAIDSGHYLPMTIPAEVGPAALSGGHAADDGRFSSLRESKDVIRWDQLLDPDFRR